MLAARVLVGSAVHLRDDDFVVVRKLLSKLCPRGRQLLAMSTPGCIEFNKGNLLPVNLKEKRRSSQSVEAFPAYPRLRRKQWQRTANVDINLTDTASLRFWKHTRTLLPVATLRPNSIRGPLEPRQRTKQRKNTIKQNPEQNHTVFNIFGMLFF